jgi:hypothetical protein
MPTTFMVGTKQAQSRLKQASSYWMVGQEGVTMRVDGMVGSAREDHQSGNGALP